MKTKRYRFSRFGDIRLEIILPKGPPAVVIRYPDIRAMKMQVQFDTFAEACQFMQKLAEARPPELREVMHDGWGNAPLMAKLAYGRRVKEGSEADIQFDPSGAANVRIHVTFDGSKPPVKQPSCRKMGMRLLGPRQTRDSVDLPPDIPANKGLVVTLSPLETTLLTLSEAFGPQMALGVTSKFRIPVRQPFLALLGAMCELQYDGQSTLKGDLK